MVDDGLGKKLVGQVVQPGKGGGGYHLDGRIVAVAQHKGQGQLCCHGLRLLVIYGEVWLDAVLSHRLPDDAGAVGVQSLDTG